MIAADSQHHNMRPCALLLILAAVATASPLPCDEIFGDCDSDDVFGEQADIYADEECFTSVNEIEDSIFAGDTRSAYNDCDPASSCEKYAEQGYRCATHLT